MIKNTGHRVHSFKAAVGEHCCVLGGPAAGTFASRATGVTQGVCLVALQISSAKSPGYFSYYKSPPEIIAAEHEQELEARTAAVTAAQVKVDEAKAALERARERKRKAHIAAATAGTQSAGSSLDAWFEVSSCGRCPTARRPCSRGEGASLPCAGIRAPLGHSWR